MSTSIMYKPITDGKYCGSGSDLWHKLQDLFGFRENFILSKIDTDKLEGFRAALNKEDQKVIDFLVDGINAFGSIDVYVSY